MIQKKIIQFKKSTDNNFGEYRWNYGQVFTNNTFDASMFDDDHLFVRCAENWNLLMEESTSDRKFQVAINVVKLGDEAWLDDVLDTKVDAESVMQDFKLLDEKYPLLKVVTGSISNWVSLKQGNDKNVTNETILEYISLCDVKGGEN